jgi:hypothetical protein
MPKQNDKKDDAADLKAPSREKSAAANTKAEKLQEFFTETGINFFTSETLGDEINTVVFRTQITVHKQQLPVGVFTDDSIYSLVRIFIPPAVVSAANRDKALEYLNILNAKYKIFKYYAAGDENIVLDISVPCQAEYFDPRMVMAVIELGLNHLNEVFSELMNKVWGG